VPTYQGRDSLLRALSALNDQTLSPTEFEVVVAIDGSTDGTREALETFRAPFAIRSLYQQNRGRSAAINAGLAIARGEIVVLLDDDLLPTPDFLAVHLRAHEGREKRGIVGAVHFRLDESTPPFASYWGRRFEDFLARLATQSKPLSWRQTYTGAFSIQRADLLAVGGFDEAFDGYGLEDFELALRLTRAGTELHLSPGAIAYHEYDKDFPTAARDAKSRGRSAVIFAALHPEVEPMQFAPVDITPPSVPRRLVRYVLPGMSVAFPFIPGLVERAVGALESAGSSRIEFAYTLALEYFFLFGLREAARDGS
jgi:GT2 family glycosyltransferase